MMLEMTIAGLSLGLRILPMAAPWILIALKCGLIAIYRQPRRLRMESDALIKVSHQMDSQLADEGEKLFIINPVREDKV